MSAMTNTRGEQQFGNGEKENIGWVSAWVGIGMIDRQTSAALAGSSDDDD